MGRIQSTRIEADTNIVSILDSSYSRRENPCTFNGLVISAKAVGAAANAIITVYSDNRNNTITPTVNIVHGAKTFTINGGTVASFSGLGLVAGSKFTVSNAEDSQNNTSFTVATISDTVITVVETMTHSHTADAITITIDNIIFRGHFNFVDAQQSDGTEHHMFTNGIFCKEGLRVESSSWTNLECFVMHS